MSGHIVETAHSSPEGVEAARSFRPEIVLCDIGLAGMNGYAVAKALQQEVGPAEACLIAVSGYGQDEKRAREAGFNAHIIKPVNFDALESTLDRLGQRSGAAKAINAWLPTGRNLQSRIGRDLSLRKIHNAGCWVMLR